MLQLPFDQMHQIVSQKSERDETRIIIQSQKKRWFIAVLVGCYLSVLTSGVLRTNPTSPLCFWWSILFWAIYILNKALRYSICAMIPSFQTIIFGLVAILLLHKTISGAFFNQCVMEKSFFFTNHMYHWIILESFWKNDEKKNIWFSHTLHHRLGPIWGPQPHHWLRARIRPHPRSRATAWCPARPRPTLVGPEEFGRWGEMWVREPK